MGYVLKPVPYLAFSQILGKAVKKVQQKKEKSYLTIDVEGGKMRLDANQVVYIESQKHHVMIHGEQGEFFTQGPLKRFEERLSTKGFSKCHNAYLVNLQYVSGIVQNQVKLTGHGELALSRAKKKEFLSDLTDFMGGITR